MSFEERDPTFKDNPPLPKKLFTLHLKKKMVAKKLIRCSLDANVSSRPSNPPLSVDGQFRVARPSTWINTALKEATYATSGGSSGSYSGRQPSEC